MQKITPFLWFENQAEEAANFYVSIFPNSRIVSTQRYGAAGPGPEGSVMLVAFELEGQGFTALNGGPIYKFTPAVSFVIDCKSQGEVDHLWEKLTDGGQEQPCAWPTDRYGVTWQVVPEALPRLLADPDKAKAKRVMEAMFKMRKIDIATLERAACG